MVILIAGGTHTGKTLLAQKLLTQYHYPYLSIDHLKMGLIRSGQTNLTPTDSEKALTAYLWPIIREMIKTAIENRQNLIVEGCYIPFDWKNGLEERYCAEIQYHCLILSRHYIETHFSDIIAHENVIEQRACDTLITKEALIAENEANLALCIHYGCPYIYIDRQYQIEIPL